MTSTNNQDQCRSWYEKSYSGKGFNAQRLYPNEELCHFLGREYLSKTDKEKREHICILEIGCGLCSNLWVIIKEGLDAYGIDPSSENIVLVGETK